MKKLVLNLFAAAMCVCSAASANAAELYLTGSACQWGWDFNPKGNAMIETETPGVFKGISFLAKKDGNFKFLGQASWDGDHYVMVKDSKCENGVYQLIKTKNSNDGNWELWLGDGLDDGNYEITVDTNALTCTLRKAEYQDSPVWGKAIFMVGDATPNAWSKDNGLALKNSFETPYIYSVTNTPLKVGGFKIEIADNAPWDNWAWLYKDNTDPLKFNKGQEGDSQWKIDEDGNYDVTVNSKTGEVNVAKTVEAAVGDLDADSAPVEYFTVAGVRVAEPVSGIYIRRQGNKVQKIAF